MSEMLLRIVSGNPTIERSRGQAMWCLCSCTLRVTKVTKEAIVDETISANRLKDDAQEPTVSNGPALVTNFTRDNVAETGNQQQYQAAKQVVR
jgi:hypothetical protein